MSSNNLYKVLGVGIIVLMGCSSPDSKSPPGSSTNGRVSPIFDGPAEISYCTSAISYSGTTSTITGKAQFDIRKPFSTGGGGLGAAGEETKPIRFAEVRVTNSSGNVVQCAETDVNGDFSFVLPQGSSKFTVSINARANNNKIKVSVLDAPERNKVYALTASVQPTADKDLGSITAAADGDVLGGAFNIFDQILDVNDFLRTEVGNCSAFDAGCADFVVAPKVSAYWELGFNPGSYYSAPPVSYYLPTYSRLFILGGVNGDYNSSDTDHFDNSIIVHEYGHFLEDVFSDTDSPGGPHSGQFQIDARLAWSEGFANFINAVVRVAASGDTANANYVDTTGNVDGSTGMVFNINIESYGSCITGTPGCDKPSTAGEGNFREFAITRYLYDIVDINSDTEMSATDNVAGAFKEIWAALVKSTGFKSTGINFRDIGLLNYVQEGVLAGGTDLVNLRTMHGMPDDATSAFGTSVDNFRQHWAFHAAADNSCTAYNGATGYDITPSSDAGNEYPDSKLLQNNDFYFYRHPGGSLTVTLTYVTPSGTEADLDLYVLNDTGGFGYSESLLGGSDGEPSTGAAGNEESEAASLGSVAAGDYLINVHAYHGVGSATQYDITINNSNGVNRLCPVSIP